ncbi:MAG: hypothetical protein KF847_04745 [Pirellulales bacterium]|nr:hypothetical protein [Pirellulales bacterium]
MKQFANWILAALLAISCGGCQQRVELDHPLCETGDDVDDAGLVGEWKCVHEFDPVFGDHKPSTPLTLRIVPRDDEFECILEYGIDRAIFKGSLTSLDSAVF